MYTQGNIIYFTPFYFPNGNTCKPKYFIVLLSEENSLIIAGLPTRVDHVPSFIEKKHGCISNDKINFNCYFFEKNLPITESGWSFPLDTHIYGDEIDFFDKNRFDQIYKVAGVDYEVIGKLKDSELNQMINCFKNSRATLNKVRRKLGARA